MIKTDYDLIIIGAGASGLFAGASLSKPLNGLILEKSDGPGKKLLMTGSGQCNLTHGGSIKDFIPHYGENGSRVRSVLYKFNNLAVVEFFQRHGVSLFERENGKIFPKSLNAPDILNLLLDCCSFNGLDILYSSPVTNVTTEDSIYTVHCGEKKYRANKLIISTGGCSYPITGSDGDFFSVLSKMGIKIVPPRPALVPIHVENYPYGELSGISLTAAVTICSEKITSRTDDLLFTHNCFSGPAILNTSRYALPGNLLKINYFPQKSREQLINICLETAQGNRKQLSTLLYEILNERTPIPKRLIDLLCIRSEVEPAQISTAVSKGSLSSVLSLLTDDCFFISGTKGYKSAMATAGGVSLDEVDTKTLESKKYPGMYFIGEVLDVDGDTGGYNLQFAFSSGRLAATQLVI